MIRADQASRHTTKIVARSRQRRVDDHEADDERDEPPAVPNHKFGACSYHSPQTLHSADPESVAPTSQGARRTIPPPGRVPDLPGWVPPDWSRQGLPRSTNAGRLGAPHRTIVRAAPGPARPGMSVPQPPSGGPPSTATPSSSPPTSASNNSRSRSTTTPPATAIQRGPSIARCERRGLPTYTSSTRARRTFPGTPRRLASSPSAVSSPTYASASAATSPGQPQ